MLRVVQLESPGVAQVGPVKPPLQMQPQTPLVNIVVPEFSHLLVSEQAANEAGEEELFADCRGTTIRKMGINTAAAIKRMSIMMTTVKHGTVMPQMRRRPAFRPEEVLEESLLYCGSAFVLLLKPFSLPGHSDRGVPMAGAGNAESMSDMEESRLPGGRLPSRSLDLPNISSMPSRDAVLPRSRFDASFVALLMRSVSDVVEPRASMSRTASMSRRGGRFEASRFVERPRPGAPMPRPKIGASDEAGEVESPRMFIFDFGTGGASLRSGGSRSSFVV